MYVVHEFESPDSTYLHNLRDKHIHQKGVYWGGNCEGNAQLQVEISPFTCKTYDGMTVTEEELTTAINIPPDNEWKYVGLYAEYLQKSRTKHELTYYPVDLYPQWDKKDYFVIFCRAKRSKDGLTIEVDNSCKEVPSSETVIKVIDSAFDLPEINPDLKKGYCRWVKSENLLYVYDGEKWSSMNVSGYITGTGVFSDFGVEVIHNIGHTNYRVIVSPTEFADDSIGEWFIEKENNKFIVHRSGTANTEFNWLLTTQI